MKIVIATGIYPPDLGGPAEYAKNLSLLWREEGHDISLQIFSRLNYLPSGIRHFVYFFKIIKDIRKADFVLALDTFSCAFPALLASKIFGKKIILRTGGDFLWEAYVERTGEKVLMRNFYDTSLQNLNLKEKLTFRIIGFVLRNVSAIIWSTRWQRDIFLKPYRLENQRNFIVENYYAEKRNSEEPVTKNFLGASRKLKWKNLDTLTYVFDSEDVVKEGAVLDLNPVPHSEFIEKVSRSYAVILVSLGDISPNTILDAISLNKPFILTEENGLTDRIKDIGIFVNPLNQKDITEKVKWLCNTDNYNLQVTKLSAFTWSHTWKDIGREYLTVLNSIQ